MITFSIDCKPLALLVNESLCKHGVKFKTTLQASGTTVFEFESLKAIEKARKAIPEWNFSQ